MNLADVPRRCWPYVQGTRPRKSAVVLGWPCLLTCPGDTHNTLYAARKPVRKRCICPRAKEILREFRDKNRDKRNMAQRVYQQSKRKPGDKRRAVRAEDLLPAGLPTVPVDIPADVLPACLVMSLGGDMPDKEAEDFYDESTGQAGDAARFRAQSRCWVCPMQRACLIGALERKETAGIWGGLTTSQRLDAKTVRQELDLMEGKTNAA